MSAYPAWRYHPDAPGRIVQTPAEDEALGDGWVDSPLKFPGVTPAPLPAPEVDEPDAKPARPKRK